LLSLAGSACDCGLPSGANGKHHGVGERHSSRWESGGSCATWPAVAMDPGISPGAKPSPWDSPMPTSNRSVSHPCSARVSATSRTAVFGPVRTVVWEGRSREAPPYPDPWPIREESYRLSAGSGYWGTAAIATRQAREHIGGIVRQRIKRHAPADCVQCYRAKHHSAPCGCPGYSMPQR
jgi:hypothetical protein